MGLPLLKSASSERSRLSAGKTPFSNTDGSPAAGSSWFPKKEIVPPEAMSDLEGRGIVLKVQAGSAGFTCSVVTSTSPKQEYKCGGGCQEGQRFPVHLRIPLIGIPQCNEGNRPFPDFCWPWSLSRQIESDGWLPELFNSAGIVKRPHRSRMVKAGRTGPSASIYDGSEKLPVGVCAGSICADELEENACVRHGIR